MDTRGFNEKDIMSSLDGIAEAISSGGGGSSSLPEVNSDDNGKVLTVVNGAWDKATASGGGDDFYKITFSYDPDAENPPSTLACDKTYSEIQSAWLSGKTLIYKIMLPLSDEWSSDQYSGICIPNEGLVDGEPHLNAIKAIVDSFWFDNNKGVLCLYHEEIIYDSDGTLRLEEFNWEEQERE